MILSPLLEPCHESFPFPKIPRSRLLTIFLCGADEPEADAPQVELIAGEPDVDGPFDSEIVARVVRHHLGDLQDCRFSTEEFEGHVTLRWYISPRGAVEDVEVAESTLNTEEFEQCLVDAIDALTFPGPHGDLRIEVSYPFEIQSSSQVPASGDNAEDVDSGDDTD